MAQITFVDKPTASINTSGNTPQSDARSRAIAALSGGSSNNAQASVPNQTNIAVEALAAASPAAPINDSEEPSEESRQEFNGEQDAESAPEVTTPKEEVPLSTQHAVIARKEKALRIKAQAQEASFKAREAALQAREAEISSKQTQDLGNYVSKDALKRNALSVLTDLGVSYDQLSQQALQAQSPEYQSIQEMRQEMERELQKVREEQANTRKSFEQQQAESYQQALRQIETEVNQLVKTDPSFEMIRETKQAKEVVKLIERTFKEDGELLTVERAAELVEEAIAEEAMKVSRINKIQERLKTAQNSKGKTQAAAQPTAKQPAQPQSPNQLTTLTNTVASTRPLTAKERAILAFKNQLNNK